MTARALEWIVTIVDGKLPRDVAHEIASVVRRMDGKRIALTIKDARRKRSNPQNRYYWGVVIPHVEAMFHEAGNDVDAETVHAFLKEHVGSLVDTMFLPDGKRRTVTRSTTNLTTLEFEAYMEKVRSWAASFGYEIPLPNEDIGY